MCKGTNAHSFSPSRGLFTVLCCLENPFRRDSVGADVAKRVNGGPQDDTSAVDVTLLPLRTLETRRVIHPGPHLQRSSCSALQMCRYDVERWSARQSTRPLVFPLHDYVIPLRSCCCWVCKGTNEHCLLLQRVCSLCCAAFKIRSDGIPLVPMWLSVSLLSHRS